MDIKIEKIVKNYDSNKNRLMDILLDVQHEFGHIPNEASEYIAKQLSISVVKVKETLSFYHFFSKRYVGRNTIYLNDSVVANMKDREYVKHAFEQAADCKFGEVSDDEKIGLFNTSCIGMNDQEPAAIINGEIFPNLTPKIAKQIVEGLRTGKDVKDLLHQGLGCGNNSLPEIQSMVNNNIYKKGDVIFSDYTNGVIVDNKLKTMQPADVISEVTTSKIRGRGGAGFPTGLKWTFASQQPEKDRYLICNADEGEPGTFKDRVLLTERAEMLFEGMAIAAYAIQAETGILYLRYEYKYLETYLEKVLADARANNRLGENIGGIDGFNFDIRIQFGAGAYVCGEETALIESCEGKRGEPRDKPPFPIEKGYLGKPTVVNNVETFCSVVRIIEKGGTWYNQMGTADSSGTKLLSISGDIRNAGIYEIEWGMTINEMLEMVDARNVQAVQVAGPSGQLIGEKDFDRKICYGDLATGGAMIVFRNGRDLLSEVVLNFMEFFVEESCGSCTTCRIIPELMTNKLKSIIDLKGVYKDIDDLEEWAKILPYSRCGLGQTAANPITSSIKNFRDKYEAKVHEESTINKAFDLYDAVKESCQFVDRVPNAH